MKNRDAIARLKKRNTYRHIILYHENARSHTARQIIEYEGISRSTRPDA